MAIDLIQYNSSNKIHTSFKKSQKEYKSYLEYNERVITDTNTHPLPPKGHLIHDNLGNSVKYFFKDIAYDFKSIKNGINGTANDHQLGRLNDIGIVTAGILIATYLASQTKNPKARAMEYIGLGAFLTAMSIYPKLLINTPAKLIHGYDIDKEYIDDQGRKKSVMQDSNYVPYDMYLGEIPEEDISLIGDKMGIPKDIKNRNDLIREQMRKIATQNNTLWMLTAGITPALTALLCCGLENYLVAPAIEKSNIASYQNAVSKILDKTSNMSSNIEDIHSNSLSRSVESLLKKHQNKEITKNEFNELIDLLSENLFENTNEGIREDLVKILEKSANKGSTSYLISDSIIDEMILASKNTITKANKAKLEKVLVPSKEEIENIIKKLISNDVNLSESVAISEENLVLFRESLRNLIDTKIVSINDVPREFLNSQRNNIIEKFSSIFKSQKSLFLSEESYNKILDFSRILGEFKENQAKLSKIKDLQIDEHVIASSYNKFEKTLINELGFKFSDLKKMRESESYTKELLDKKLLEISKDEVRFSKIMEKLGSVISEMEVNLHGKNEAESKILELISAIENNYNNTALRLSKLGGFDTTINRLVKEDVSTLGNTLKSKSEVFDFLDGIIENKFRKLFENNEFWALSEEKRAEYIKANSKGIGSSKNLEISKLLERYQGAKNSFNRILLTLDIYRRGLSPESFAKALQGKDPKYIVEIIAKAQETMLSATSSDHTMKLHTTNNPNFYKDLMHSIYASEAGNFYSTKEKGFVSDITKNALGKNNSVAQGNILDRFQFYITRFRNIVGNSNVDFTKPYHILNPNIRSYYTTAEKTRLSFFNLIGQTPVDMVKNASGRKYANQKWVRIISAITGSVFGVTLLAQLGFGKINNPQNVIKKVDYDKN